MMKKVMKIMNNVEIKDKVLLTIPEAALYSNIGQNTLSDLLSQPRCPFVLYVGNKRLVKRKEFEKYIAETVEVLTLCSQKKMKSTK